MARYCSQFGEDKIIEAELARIGGPRNHWCFEVGASDGVKNSNVNYFIMSCGWHAVMIEADRELYAQLEPFNRMANVQTFNECIYPGDLDRILHAAGAPTDMDFGVIDIDGQDYYVWEAMITYKPRIMCVEFSPYVDENHLPGIGEDGRGGYNQAGAGPIMDLARRKGYELIGETFCNKIFRLKAEAPQA